MDLPLFSASFAAISITLYVLLDGFDLGVGVLLLFQPDQESRNHMVDAITPTWDGNETWLIMAGVALLAGFPVAYGILMPALYFPLIIMLLSLALRGVSFEFRFQTLAHRRNWDLVFGVGSLVAASMQGLVIGNLLQGVPVRGESFAGGVFHWMRLLPLLCAVALVIGYMVLGAAWLYLKGSAGVDRFGKASIRLLAPIFLFASAIAAAVALWLVPPFALSTEAHRTVLIGFAAAFIVTLTVLRRSVRSERKTLPLLLALSAFVEGIAALSVIVFPDVIPFRMSLWAAASSHMSQVFLLSGAVLVTPVVIGYSAFSYWIFRGKTPVQGWNG